MTKDLPRWDSIKSYRSVEELEQFARVRLIAMDLDGTAVDQPGSDFLGQLTHLTRSLVNPYRVRVTIATGRAYNGVRRLVNSLPIRSDTPVILYNGSVVAYSCREELLWRRRIHEEYAKSVVRIVSDYKMSALLYFCGAPRSLDFALDGPIGEFVVGIGGNSDIEKEPNDLGINWQTEFSGSPSAILVRLMGDEKRKTGLIQALSELEMVSVTKSGQRWVEVRPAGTNKAWALSKIADILGISQSAVLAIGDNDNDVEMLMWSGVGVAVANASPAAQGAANYLASRSVAHGTIEVLRLIRNARRFFAEATDK